MRRLRTARWSTPWWGVVVAVYLLLFVCTGVCTARQIEGRVDGGGENGDLTVIAVRSKNLRSPNNVVASSAVDTASGAFSLDVPGLQSVFVVVAKACKVIHSVDLMGCQLVFPRHAPVGPSFEESLVLAIPDLDRASSLWSGATAREGPHRTIGFGLLALLFLVALAFVRPIRSGIHRRPTGSERPLPSQPSPTFLVRWAPLIFAAACGCLYGINLGRDPLDLLEYSYFHEGLRPTSTFNVLVDFISQELAHGPVMALILRLVSSFSSEPWMLRLPSVVFSVLFVVCVWDMTRRELTRSTALASGILALTAPLAVYYGRDATPYTLSGLCAAASLWVLVIFSSSPRAPRRAVARIGLWLLFSLIHVVGFFSHYTFAFVSVSQFVGLSFVWWRNDRRLLGEAWLAFTVAGILPVLVAPQLLHMFEVSGIRFALMSPVYPSSPGLTSFMGTFLAVLTGLPTSASWGVFVTLPLCLYGVAALYERSRLLGVILGVQVVFVVLFLVFIHTMSTTTGGDRVFYAFRWARPLLLAMVLPMAALSLTRWKWVVPVLILVWSWQSVELIRAPSRPDQRALASVVEKGVKAGDAYAVLPAAFYGDPLQYYLANGEPPALITNMRSRDLPIGGVTVHGPLMEHRLPFETVIANDQHERLWVVAYREAMFGVPKFDAKVTQQTLAWLDQRYQRLAAHRFPFVDLYLYDRSSPVETGGKVRTVSGRIRGYQGIWPLHVAALKTRNLADTANPLGWATVDPQSGRFQIPLSEPVDRFYLMAQLDRHRSGRRLNGEHLFFLRKLPIEWASVQGKTVVFDISNMELAYVVRESGFKHAWPIALGLMVLLFGIGYLVYRREPCRPRGPPQSTESGGAFLWLIALGSTLLLLPRLGSEALELLEFTYLHEGLRPESILALLTDPISAELSHPPVWPLVLRCMAIVSTDPWWLRLPSVFFHLTYVVVVFHLVNAPCGRRTALLVALIAAIAPIATYYGRDATPYALLACISAGATLCAVREHWGRFVVLMVVGFFTHYTVGVLGVALAIGLIWHRFSIGDTGRMRRAIVAFGLICPLPLIWSVHFIRTFLASGVSTRLMSGDYLPDPGFPAYVARFGATLFGLPQTASWLTPVVLVLVVLGAIHALRRYPLFGRLISVQLSMVLGYIVFVYFMYMQFAGGRIFYAYRWTAVFLPAIASCLVFGLLCLPMFKRTTFVILAVLSSFASGTLVVETQRPEQQAAVRQIDAEKEPGDAFCALPAVYYGQLFNYHIAHGEPDDLLAWPTWTDGLYGPFHGRNTTVETQATNLAFKRIWVAQFDEQMFGTQKFDLRTSDHQLDWMRRNLIADGHWNYRWLTLHRFKVPPAPLQAWKDGSLSIDFRQGIKNFRYFPEYPHTQKTGLVMSQKSVALRVPAPTDKPKALDLTVEVIAGQALVDGDLRLDGIDLEFEGTSGGGRWKGSVPVKASLLDFRLHRSDRLVSVHRNTIFTLTLPGTVPAPAE